jgi:hypothetical protein
MFASGRPIGTLARSDVDADTILFGYRGDCAPEHAVSNATTNGVLERVAAGVDAACDEIDQFARAEPGFSRAAASLRAVFSRGLNRSLGNNLEGSIKSLKYQYSTHDMRPAWFCKRLGREHATFVLKWAPIVVYIRATTQNGDCKQCETCRR